MAWGEKWSALYLSLGRRKRKAQESISGRGYLNYLPDNTGIVHIWITVQRKSYLELLEKKCSNTGC